MAREKQQPLTLFKHWSRIVNSKSFLSQATGNNTNLCVNISDLVPLIKVLFVELCFICISEPKEKKILTLMKPSFYVMIGKF